MSDSCSIHPIRTWTAVTITMHHKQEILGHRKIDEDVLLEPGWYVQRPQKNLKGHTFFTHKRHTGLLTQNDPWYIYIYIYIYTHKSSISVMLKVKLAIIQSQLWKQQHYDLGSRS